MKENIFVGEKRPPNFFIVTSYDNGRQNHHYGSAATGSCTGVPSSGRLVRRGLEAGGGV